MNDLNRMDLLNGHQFIDGNLVSSKIRRIIDAIREYSDELEVQWIPPAARSEGQAAFRILHTPVGQPPYVIKHVQTEEEFDERILKNIIAGDQRNGQTSLTEYEAWEEAGRRIQHQEALDKMEELHDIAYHYARSNKNTYRVNDSLVFKEGSPGNKAADSRKVHLGPTGKRGKM